MATVQTGATGKVYTTSTNGAITVKRPDGSTSTVKPGTASYNATVSAMKNDGVGMSSPSNAVAKPSAVVVPIAQPQIVQPQQPIYDPTQDIERLKQAQINARISALDSARNKALSNLSNERANIAPTYANQRNDVTTKNMVDKMNFAEYLSNRGANTQGSADQLGLASNIALQNNISGLKQAEAQEYMTNDRRVTDVNNGYLTDSNNAMADIESNTMQELINARQRADETNYARKQEQLKNDISSINAYYNDFQSEINRRKALNPNDPLIPFLEAQRAQKKAGVSSIQTNQLENEAKIISNKYAAQIAQGQLDQIKLENEYKKLVNAGYPKQQAAELALTNAQTRNVGASTALGYARLAWEKDPNNPDNINKLGKGSLQYKDYVSMGRDMLDKGYQTVDSNPSSPTYGQAIYSKINTPKQTLDWVKGLPITPDEKARLANDLGL